jgi:homocysteine S-methyltransferase
MTKIADIHAQRSGEPTFICDFSPPRGASFTHIDSALSLNAHCLSIPYNPGKAVYANSPIAASAVNSHTGKDVAFTIATRDMNILATQSLLLGAALLGLHNVVIVRGDDFTPAELRRAKPIHDRAPTTLIRSVREMNEGTDFRGRPLSASTDFCIGATIDTNRNIDSEVRLTHRKIESGAHFLISQPSFTTEAPLQFIQAYEQAYGAPPAVPLFFGIQMIAPASRAFSPVPQSVRDSLRAGADHADIAIRTINSFIEAGITAFYLMPPIFSGGARDYPSAAQVLAHFVHNPP